MFADYKCKKCGSEKIDEWVKNHTQQVKCDQCDTFMEKKLSAPNAQTWSRRL
jgi:uncharacterized Zn finger protein